MKTSNRFLIFLGLKCKEIGHFLKEIWPIFVMMAVCVSICMGVESNIGWLRITCLSIAGGVIALFAGIVLVSIIYGLFTWIKDNWSQAGEISQQRKRVERVSQQCAELGVPFNDEEANE